MKSILSHLRKNANAILNANSIAVDFGTTTTRIAIHGKGVVLREPTFIGLNNRTNEYIFFGNEAYEIFGKAPSFISIIHPVDYAIISDFDSSVKLLERFFEKAVHPFFFKNRLFKSKYTAYTTVPASATEVEQRAIEEALIKAGAGSVRILEKSIATGYGADLPVFSNDPAFIIDLGAGLIEMAIVTTGGIIASKTVRAGGLAMDTIIKNYIHLKYGMVIGESTAQKLKNGLMSFDDEKKVLTVRGKSLENGLPRSIRVTSADVREALIASFNGIVDGIKDMLETVAPEVVDGIVKNGITLAGGLANIPDIDKYIMQDIKIPVNVPENPQDATIQGVLKLLGNKERLERVVIR